MQWKVSHKYWSWKETEGYIISYNGARIIQCESGKELHQINILKQNIHKLSDMCMQEGVYIHTYMDNAIITSGKNKYIEIEKKLIDMEINIPDDFKSYVNMFRQLCICLCFCWVAKLTICFQQENSCSGNCLSLQCSCFL